MPFICLANANVPDGTVQITDLWPNVSQRNQVLDPPGQNRYLARPGTTQPAVDLVTGLVVGRPQDSNLHAFQGLGAYLVDKVEPGALNRATADITLAALPNAADRIIINGVIYVEFTAAASDPTAAGTVGAPLLVNIKATAALTADELTVVLTNAGAIVTMRGLNVNIYPAVSNVAALVTMDADFTGGGGQLGVTGDMTLSLPVVGSEARITLPTVPRLARVSEAWTPAAITLAVAAVQSRVDGGQGMTLADVNTALTAVGSELTGVAASSASVGTLRELLSLLAGRVYEVPSGGLKFTAAVAPDSVHVWSATLLGLFTIANTTWDTGMSSGEWGATTSGRKALKTGGSYKNPTFLTTAGGAAGGDVVNNEIAEARATYDGTHFQASVNAGQLFRLSAAVSLFPDPDVQAFVSRRHPNGPAALARVAPLTNQRIVTVYDDDGSLLV